MNSGFKEFQNIIKSREESIKFLEASLTKKDFLSYLSTFFNKDDLIQEIDFSNFKEKLSENEFQQLNTQYHYPSLWETLEEQKFTDIDAKQPIKWLSITYQLIENDLIEPYYLAYRDNSLNGKKNIIDALRLAEKDNNEKLFDFSRAIMRRIIGSIPGVRGRSANYTDIPFAKAWWIMHHAFDFEKNTNNSSTKLIDFMANTKSAYVNFVERGLQLTIIFDKNIRDGLFLHIIDKDDLKAKEFKEITYRVGVESAWRAMGSLTPNDNKMIIKSLIE